jgi:ribosomal protein S18 acetylase RimI-like enzyme
MTNLPIQPASRRIEIHPATYPGDEQAVLLLARDGDGQLIARATVGEWETPYGYVYSVYVEPSFRRQGHGRAILAAAIELARETGKRSLRLYVKETNDAAIAMYRSAGFVTISLEKSQSSFFMVHPLEQLK